MDHFQGVTPEERYKNEQMNHMRQQTELLKQIAQLLNPAHVSPKGVVGVEKDERDSKRRDSRKAELSR